MNRPSLSTVKRLFAMSGNVCAFPGCTIALVDPTTGVVIGQICHIKSPKKKGPRHDSTQDDKELHSYAYLLLMCPMHHTIVDRDRDSYTVERLLNIKKAHELQAAKPLDVPDYIVEEMIIQYNDNTQYHEYYESTIIKSDHQYGGQTASVINNNAVDVIEIRYVRRDVKPVHVGKIHVSSHVVENIIFSVIFIVGILAYSIQYLNPSQFHWWSVPTFITMLVGLRVIFFAKDIEKTGFVRQGSLNIESDEDGGLYLTNITGVCPFCGSEVKLVTMPKGSDLDLMGLCVRNERMHTFSFDFTTLSGVYYPIKWIYHTAAK